MPYTEPVVSQVKAPLMKLEHLETCNVVPGEMSHLLDYRCGSERAYMEKFPCEDQAGYCLWCVLRCRERYDNGDRQPTRACGAFLSRAQLRTCNLILGARASFSTKQQLDFHWWRDKPETGQCIVTFYSNTRTLFYLFMFLSTNTKQPRKFYLLLGYSRSLPSFYLLETWSIEER